MGKCDDLNNLPDDVVKAVIDRIMACEDLSIFNTGVNRPDIDYWVKTTAEVLELLNSKEKNGE